MNTSINYIIQYIFGVTMVTVWRPFCFCNDDTPATDQLMKGVVILSAALCFSHVLGCRRLWRWLCSDANISDVMTVHDIAA